MEKIVYSKIKNCLISAQKVRLVADLVRGKSIDEAEGILTFTNKTAAKDIFKALRSAIANCVHNEGWDRKDLMIAKIFIDEAQTYKRGRPAARGRYRSVLKRNSHITIGLKNTNENVKKMKEEKKEVKKEDKKEEKKEIKKINKKVIKK